MYYSKPLKAVLKADTASSSTIINDVTDTIIARYTLQAPEIKQTHVKRLSFTPQLIFKCIDHVYFITNLLLYSF